MKAICVIDTSIFLEILNVPYKASKHIEIISELTIKINNDEFLFLPMATIVETGNHIAQNGTGSQRRQAAERFVKQVGLALQGNSPFTAMDFLSADKIKQWLNEFPDSAMIGSGLGDLSIIKDWERQRDLNQARRVYIWSLDNHLSSYNHIPRI